MNELEKYKQEQLSNILDESLERDTLDEYQAKGYEQGFEGVLSLDLPVKFSKWLKTLDNGTEGFDHHTKKVIPSIGFSPYDCFTDDLMTEEELYQYWINNIFKIES